jgi:hypothetical protein
MSLMIKLTKTGYSRVDAHLTGKNGEPMPYSWNSAALKDKEGKVIGLSGVGINNTD